MQIDVLTKSDTRVPRASRGFSMIEALVVVSIMLVMFVIAVPTFAAMLGTARSRAGMSNLSTLTQLCRTAAIRYNKPKSLYMAVEANEPIAFIADSNGTPDKTMSDYMTTIGHLSEKVDADHLPNTVPELTPATAFGNSGIRVRHDTMSFNPRGLPCWYDSTADRCKTDDSNGNSWIWYYTFKPPMGNNRWAALSVSAAGRVKAWYWNGTGWDN